MFLPLNPTLAPALALLPDFALILLGSGLRRVLHLGDHFWSGLEKLIYFVLFPALLFNGLVKTRIDWAAAGPLLAVAMGAMATGIVLGYGAKFFRLTPMSFASQYQCAFRFNSYIGLAVAGKLYGVPGIAAMAIVVGVMVPPANMAAVWMLARHGDASVWRELARNPLIIATVAGVTANVAGFQPPEPLLQFLGRLGEAAIALGLLAVGAGLRTGNTKVGAGGTAAAIYLLAVKLVALPLATLGLIRWVGLTGVYADVALVFSALPTASSAYILAQRMGGDGARVAWLISVGTVLGMLSLPFWLAVR
ncbi:MAG: auxin efflux carrier [Rhodocyclaceae bacterium]|nr:MAG: auxin efflux carrier [Rhodocyclaceae bacterium]TND05933.1 MAG: auxin efflux carrier [Rhodocyclaceae bacterium]